MGRGIYAWGESVLLQVQGEGRELFLNEMTLRDIPFFRARLEEGGALTLRIRGWEQERVQQLAEELGLQSRVLRRRGPGKLLWGVRSRWLLLTLPFLLLLAVFRLSDYIWELDVEGNERLSRGEILEALEQEGVGIGTNGLHIDNELLRSRMQARLGDLIWCTVQVSGSRAVVQVRERRLPPEVVDEGKLTDLVAVKTGLLEKLSVLEGSPQVQQGQLVLQGQTLISGSMPDLQGQSRKVHALGEAWARTWYEMTLCMPLAAGEKYYTGEEQVKTAIKICNFRFNFYRDSGISYDRYDKMTKEVRPALFGLALPVALLQTRCLAYDMRSAPQERQQVQSLLEQRLLALVREAAGGAELTQSYFETREAEGLLYVTLRAECLEQIGR